MGKHITTSDVVILGGGPAGSIMARELSLRGIDVKLLEKARFPRYKPCGGGVTVRAASLLPFDIRDIAEDTICGARVSFRLGDVISYTSDRPLTYMVMRDKFDYHLYRMAGEAGAKISDGEGSPIPHLNDGFVEVISGSQSIKAQVLIGADGAGSNVSRATGLMQSPSLHIGIQSEVVTSQETMSCWRGVVGLDFGHIPTGYAWIFPKTTRLSVGAGGPIKRAKRLRPYLYQFLKNMVSPEVQITSLKSRFMPMRGKDQAIVKGRCLLLGDAAGLVDPLTGEGIYPAIKSAMLAAPAIEKYLGGSLDSLQEYQEAVDKQIMPELGISRALARMSSWAPKAFFNRFRDDVTVWNSFCRLLRGEIAYSDIAGSLGPIRPLFLLAKLLG